MLVSAPTYGHLVSHAAGRLGWHPVDLSDLLGTFNFLGEGIPSEWASGTLEQLIEQVWNWKKKNLRNFPSRTTPSIIVDEARMVHGEWKTWYENRIP